MPRILLILSVVFIIVASVFSVQTKTQIEKIVAEEKASKENLANSKKEQEKARGDSKLAQDQLAAEKAKAERLATERNTLKTDLASAKSELNESAQKLTAATTQVEDLTKKLDEAKTATSTPSTAVADLEAKLKESETKVGELSTVNQTLTQKNSETEAKLQNLMKAENRRQSAQMVKGLTGRVLAVNRAYNFIVISLGDKQGVVMNGEMIIKRGGSQVARVKITSVEPTTSIADIVPGTLARGVSVLPEDEVIYPGAGI